MQRSLRLSKRVRQLELWIGAVRRIAGEIRYAATPLGRIVQRLQEAGEYRELRMFGPCAILFGETDDFPGAWRAAADEVKSGLALTQRDWEPVLALGNTLGTTDVAGQVADCERCIRLLDARLEAAREDCGKRGRMYASLGVLTGVFFFILLL